MDEYKNFTSLPEAEEQTFVVYERFSREAAKKAMNIGLIAAAAFFVLTLIVVFSHSKPTESKIKKEDIQTSKSGFDDTADEPATDTSAEKKDDEAEAWEDDEAEGDEGEGDDKAEKKADDKKADDKKADDKKDEGKKDDKK